MQEELFLLLRLGLGTSKPDEEDLSRLSCLDEKQWEQFAKISSIHGVAAIVFDGISNVVNYKGNKYLNHFDNQSFWSGLIASWGVGIVEQQYELGNKKQLAVIKDIQRRWSQAGIRMLLMKGMAMGTYYPIPYHRCPGDIDCYLFDDYKKGNELAKSLNAVVDERWYKHSQILYMGQIIENHQFFVHTRGGKKSKQLNNLLCSLLSGEDFNFLQDTNVLLPPPMFNAVFLSYHAQAHFLAEGLLLKQLVDWAMFLQKDQKRVDWDTFYEICEKFHLRRFVDVSTDIAVHCLNVKPLSTLCTTSQYTQKVLESALKDDDCIFSKPGGVWSKRLKLLSNLYKNRWKHHEIYQHSIIRQLWFYLVGFVFKTEE